MIGRTCGGATAPGAVTSGGSPTAFDRVLACLVLDHVFDLPYARSPHPSYADEHGSHDGATKIPAWEMIRFSVNIMRGCFGGCTFCSITEHEGRIIQNRSEDSIIREVEAIRELLAALRRLEYRGYDSAGEGCGMSRAWPANTRHSTARSGR